MFISDWKNNSMFLVFLVGSQLETQSTQTIHVSQIGAGDKDCISYQKNGEKELGLHISFSIIEGLRGHRHRREMTRERNSLIKRKNIYEISQE